MESSYLAIFMQFLFACGFSAIMLGVSMLCGRSVQHNKIKDTPYECGMLPIGKKQVRFSIHFYIIAMLFVLFDIEAVFLYPWALNYKNEILRGFGWQSFLAMLIFVIVLLIAYIYALKRGIFKWRANY